MRQFKARIEKGFEQSGHFFYRHPKKVLAVLFSVIALLTLQIPKTAVDTSSEALLHKNDPHRLDFNAFRDQFGRAEAIIVAARPEPGKIFSPVFFEQLRSLTQDLEDHVPHVKEVTSLINIRDTRGQGDELIVEDLAENWPQTPEDFAALESRAMHNPLYTDYVLSRDGKTAGIIIETDAVVAVGGGLENSLDDGFEGMGEDGGQAPAKVRYFSEAENEEVVQAVAAIVDRHRAQGFDLVYSGGPIIQDVFNKTVMGDTRLCVILAVIANVIFLTVLFRRFSGVFFPVFIVLSALLCTMGLFPIFGVPFKLTATIIPAFLVAVGVADSIHILAIFYRRLNEGDDKETAICHALGHSGLAVVMTSLTTAAGLLSFSMAELTALAELGIFAAVGVLLALLFTITMLPSMLALFPIRPVAAKPRRTMLMDNFMVFVADFATARPWVVIVISAAVFLVPARFLPRLVFSDDVVAYFPDGMAVKNNIRDLDKRFNGIISLEAVLDFGRPEALYEPEVLNKIDQLIEKIKQIRISTLHVGKVISINDVVKEINQALNENDPAYYSLPDSRQAIAQELLLFENSGADDLERIVDTRFSKARITVRMPWADSVVYEAVIDKVSEEFEEVFGREAKLTITGEMALMARTIPAALRSMAKSYGIAFVVITIMMVLLVGHVRTGLIAMFPNLLPIVLVMGLIAWAGVTLNLNTLMIGSIAMGLVVDDTMHFIYNYRRYYEQGFDPKKAVRLTLLGAGRAMLFTSLVLCAGFLVLLAGTLKTSVQFGVFTAIIIMLALLTDFILASALMVVLSKRKKQPA